MLRRALLKKGLVVFFFRTSVKVYVAEQSQKIVKLSRWNKIKKLNGQPWDFFTLPWRTTKPIFVSELLKGMAQKIEAKLFRLSLEPTRSVSFLCSLIFPSFFFQRFACVYMKYTHRFGFYLLFCFLQIVTSTYFVDHHNENIHQAFC